jgi:hypothetical protein
VVPPSQKTAVPPSQKPGDVTTQGTVTCPQQHIENIEVFSAKK